MDVSSDYYPSICEQLNEICALSINMSTSTKYVVFGQARHVTLTSMLNYAEFLRLQDRFEEAHTLGDEVVDVQKRVCGEDHPGMLKVLYNLACILQDKGEYDESKRLQP
jgi:hypothetical protein